MSDIAIKVEGLGKRYRIGTRQRGHKTLREKINDVALSPFHTLRSLGSGKGHSDSQFSNRKLQSETIWALKDVSFDLKLGEVVGIIGRNGAGKSTLLKVLSRITEPTEGYADIQGRVGSLLEVGTGFHHELTGRENIYLNGSILGMKKAEIEKQFDEIVSFAEVKKFIDTPVKHYSSGMYLRLAFAVAAHLNPEILIVDEVLAVGDAPFQKKCLGKMGEVARTGRTVLFVSHNMAAIASLCTRGIVLNGGSIAFDGEPTEAISSFLHRISEEGAVALDQRKDRQGGHQVKFTALRLLDGLGNVVDTATSGDSLTIELEYDVAQAPARNVAFIIQFLDAMGQRVFTCATRIVDQNFPQVAPDTRVRCTIPVMPLAPGNYNLNVMCKVDGQVLADSVERATELCVAAGDFFGTGKILAATEGGHCLVRHHWELST